MLVKQTSNKQLLFPKFSFLIVLNCLFFISNAQTKESYNSDTDTNIYFTDFSEKLSLQLFSQTRTNLLDIVLGEEKLQLRPNGMTNLGFGGSWKGLALNLSIGIPGTGGNKEVYGETERFDIQFSSMTSRFYFDLYLNRYKGYFNDNPNDFVNWNKTYFPQINDLIVKSVGVSGLYILNHKKYSYKAAYKRTAVQHKNAGSFALGIYGNYDDVYTDYGFIPREFPDSIKNNFDLKEFDNFNLGISFGYMYTFVIWKCIVLNIAAFPGVGFQYSNITKTNNQKFAKSRIAPQLKGTLALGYEHKNFYLGLSSSATLRVMDYFEYDIDLSTEEFRFYIGKRFSL